MSKKFRKIQREYAAGEVIFSEDSSCDGIYIINSGEVLVYKTIESEEVALATIGSQGMFGEMAFIDEQTRSASVRALQDTKVTIITKEMFNDQFAQLPDWVMVMIKLLVGRLRLTNDKLRKVIDENKLNKLDDRDTGGLFIAGEEQKLREESMMKKSGEMRQKKKGAKEKETTRTKTAQLLKDLDF